MSVNPPHFRRTPQGIRLGQSIAARQLPAGWRTRFAPAPTGFLHLGHVVSALHVWGVARAHGGRVLLRIEDHDRSRCRPEFERALLDDLDWLGFTPDIAMSETFRLGNSVVRQSDNVARYEAVLRTLAARGMVYGCTCTRKDIAEVAGDRFGEETPYPGTCANADHKRSTAQRFRVTDAEETFDDISQGVQSQRPPMQCGDFLLRDRNGNFTYQFCVTVDDIDQNTDVIIRGEDLLSSTGRQLQLARSLGRASSPQFLHHALVKRADGRKLSKSLGDTGVREMRDAGKTPQQVLGHAAYACGLIEADVPLDQDKVGSVFL